MLHRFAREQSRKKAEKRKFMEVRKVAIGVAVLAAAFRATSFVFQKFGILQIELQ